MYSHCAYFYLLLLLLLKC